MWCRYWRFRVPEQAGKRGHPQNWDPALAPFRAVRRTMGSPHLGQAGVRQSSAMHYMQAHLCECVCFLCDVCIVYVYILDSPTHHH